MRFHVGGRKAIGEHADVEVQIGRVAHRVLHRELGRKAHHTDAIDVAIAQERFKVGISESACRAWRAVPRGSLS